MCGCEHILHSRSKSKHIHKIYIHSSIIRQSNYSMVHNNNKEYINQHIPTLSLSVQRHWSGHHNALLTFDCQHITQQAECHTS